MLEKLPSRVRPGNTRRTSMHEVYPVVLKLRILRRIITLLLKLKNIENVNSYLAFMSRQTFLRRRL